MRSSALRRLPSSTSSTSNAKCSGVCCQRGSDERSGFHGADEGIHGVVSVKQLDAPEAGRGQVTAHYRGLANHYDFESRKIQPRSPRENGDVEQRHYRLKKAVDQALMLRGSRDFASRADYEKFLEQMFEPLDAGRQERLREELKVLRRLPSRRHQDFREVDCQVGAFGTHSSYASIVIPSPQSYPEITLLFSVLSI